MLFSRIDGMKNERTDEYYVVKHYIGQDNWHESERHFAFIEDVEQIYNVQSPHIKVIRRKVTIVEEEVE